MSTGTGHSCAAAAKGIPSPSPQCLSEDDFAKVRAAVLERDGGSKPSPASPFVLGTNGAAGSAPASSPGGAPVVPSSPSTAQQKQQQQQPRWGSTGGGGSPAIRSADGGSGGIDQRLFAPVLRAILAGEGDHVLRRSLLCHPFLKTTKGGSTSAAAAGGSYWGGAPLSSKGSGSGAASSPLSGSSSGGGRRKDGKGSKGVKAKKRDRDRASRNQEDLGGTSSPSSAKSGGGGRGGGGGGGPERASPLDVSREMGRLADCAAADGSLQSTLILVKTLLCTVDPGTKAAVLGASGSPRKQSQQQRQGGRAGGGRTATSAFGARGSGSDSNARMGSIVGSSSACSTELTLDAAPLKALVEPRLSGWADMMELLRREKYRERMVALRGRPSLTVCSGKAEMRGRLEAKGEFAGVVTAVQVSPLKARVD